MCFLKFEVYQNHLKSWQGTQRPRLLEVEPGPGLLHLSRPLSESDTHQVWELWMESETVWVWAKASPPLNRVHWARGKLRLCFMRHVCRMRTEGHTWWGANVDGCGDSCLLPFLSSLPGSWFGSSEFLDRRIGWYEPSAPASPLLRRPLPWGGSFC